MPNYPPPLNRFFSIGRPIAASEWPNYCHEYGVEKAHIPELIRMVGDQELWEDEGRRFWAPLHAWRSLGQLRAEEAILPLLDTLQLDDEMDVGGWGLSELPRVLAMIGPASIPALASFLANPARGDIARGAVSEALALIAREHPESRDECLGVLTRALESGAENYSQVNAAIIESMVNLKAVESAALIERAFQENRVDTGYIGTWEEVQWMLGLVERPEPPPPSRPFPSTYDPFKIPLAKGKAKDKVKARRKIAKASRRKNRK